VPLLSTLRREYKSGTAAHNALSDNNSADSRLTSEFVKITPKPCQALFLLFVLNSYLDLSLFNKRLWCQPPLKTDQYAHSTLSLTIALSMTQREEKQDIYGHPLLVKYFFATKSQIQDKLDFHLQA
jgi:hypothetical protein